MEWHFWYWFDIEAWHLVKVCLKSSTHPITQHLDIDYCVTLIHSIGEMASTNATHTHKLRRNKFSNHRSVHRVLGMSVNWFVYGVENYNYPNIDNDAIQVNRIVVSILFVYVFFFLVPFREFRSICVCVCMFYVLYVTIIFWAKLIGTIYSLYDVHLLSTKTLDGSIAHRFLCGCHFFPLTSRIDFVAGITIYCVGTGNLSQNICKISAIASAGTNSSINSGPKPLLFYSFCCRYC